MSAHKATPKYTQTHSQGGHSVGAYRGYLIQPDLLGTIFYVQKDGFTIGSAQSYEGAQRVIDAVQGD